MNIHLLCNDGSPIGVIPPVIHGRGVGGAELAMMTLMEVFARRGHEVTVYNDPSTPGDYEGVQYRPLNEFATGHARDVLIVFRSPNTRVDWQRFPSDQRAIWWSCDQRTVGDYRVLAACVHYIVTISPYHRDFFSHTYDIPKTKMGYIDLGVRTWEYDGEVEKIPNRLIFCSIPDRGLPILLTLWDSLRVKIENLSLVITSDYTLWGAGGPRNQQHRLGWAMKPGVEFLGAIPRAELCRHQMQAEVMAYPSTYDELFCISAAECQVTGAFPITSGIGALNTTNQFGIVIPGDPRTPHWQSNFVDRIYETLVTHRGRLEKSATRMRVGGRARFDWDVIAQTWEHLFEKGKLP